MKLYLLAALCAFFVSLIFCGILLPMLRKLKAGQNVLVYVKEHKNKNGTPTMGGLAFIPAALITAALFMRESNRQAYLTLAVGAAYLLVGFLDDYLKYKHKENLGLRARQKLFFQCVIALFVAIFCYRAHLTKLYIPFLNSVLELGIWSIPFYVFLFLAAVNAVNLTDGLDGLAASTCIPFFLAIGSMLVLQQTDRSQTIICFSLVGALLAYLLFNVSPAKIFMGDTGSLALGSLVSCVCTFTGNALYLPIIGLPFAITVLSVIIQVIYYKVSGGKRIFLMAPLHHHFQKRGHSESRISYAYMLVSAVLGVVCVISIL